MTKTVCYSDDKTLYYIKELVCGFCNWISVEKFDKLPEQHPMKLDYAVQYDNSYFRKVLPFNFWKVRNYFHIIEEQVPDDHELVKDYITCGRHN